MCPLRHRTTDGINAICCRIKHNRAKPMFESASAIFSIADAGEFRFARFYIVYEEVPLGTPESPLIVCGSSDTLCECPNVEETRNWMSSTAWKKYMNFASKNCRRLFYSGTFGSRVISQYHGSRFSFYVNCFISSVLPRIVPMAPFTSSA